MIVFFDNAKLKTNRGFSIFARNLIGAFVKMGHSQVENLNDADIHLAFVINTQRNPNVPLVLRLDGIYFNSAVNSKQMNSGIKGAYNTSDAVIIQSDFDKIVIENYFGKHKNVSVINNGTDLDLLKTIEPYQDGRINKFDKAWASSARWIRPNKRGNENIRYFIENAPEADCMLLTGAEGSGPVKAKEKLIDHERVFSLGELPWEKHISVLRRADYFLHLAIADHCPNAVVEARACDCKIICSELGGTVEIAGLDAIVIKDMDWDYKTPFDHNKPPKMDFSKKSETMYNKSIDINEIAIKYEKVFESVL